VDLQVGLALDGMGGTDTLTNIEAVEGSTFGDNITMSNAANGWASGRSRNDLVSGGTGNDFIDGGSGNDTLHAGANIDTANYTDDGFDPVGTGIQGVTVNLATGTATDNWGDTDLLTGIENVNGSNLADSITGDNNVNNLSGQVIPTSRRRSPTSSRRPASRPSAW
jgi:hypothetical protein